MYAVRKLTNIEKQANLKTTWSGQLSIATLDAITNCFKTVKYGHCCRQSQFDSSCCHVEGEGVKVFVYVVQRQIEESNSVKSRNKSI